jgi:D-alanyl-D-alanine carboxypeptidase
MSTLSSLSVTVGGGRWIAALRSTGPFRSRRPRGSVSGFALIGVIVAFALLPASAAASPPSERLGRAADAVVNAGVPGVAVYVRDKGRTTVVSRGYDDVAARRPMSVEDRFRIGSVTKTFVSALVLQLVNEGKLSLEDSVEKWLPGLVPNGGAITIRQLLSHRSGLFDYVRDQQLLAPYLHGHLDHVWTPLQIVRIATKHKPLFAPGADGKQSYSNTNYVILGLVIEKVTGHPLAAELNTRIFRPLALRHTNLQLTPTILGRHAHGYTKAFGPTVVDITRISPSLFGAAGGIVSTPADVARFYRALLQGRLVPSRLVNAMKAREGRDPAHPELRYGLGLWRQPLRCSLVWGHDGDVPGFMAIALNSGDGNRQIVVMINTDPDSLTPAQGKALNDLVNTGYCG